MRMLNYYINRGGKNLTKERHAELEKAKGILSELIAEQKEKPAPKKHTKRAAAKPRTAAKTGTRKTAARKAAKTARARKS
jgi:tRNA(adenine34) deaminase